MVVVSYSVPEENKELEIDDIDAALKEPTDKRVFVWVYSRIASTSWGVPTIILCFSMQPRPLAIMVSAI